MRRLCMFIALTVAAATSFAQQSWSAWVRQLRQEAIAEGIQPAVFDRAFANIQAPSKKVVKLDRNQPEQRLTFLKYRNTRADAYRIKIGHKEMKKYAPLLNQIGEEYGVSPCYITSFWGLESSYGRFMGKFPVIKSLATLAYDGRRAKFFRKELMYALHILNQGHVSFADLKGEWAGASGQPQFLPSSWYHYSVDHDQDGKRDIWSNHADIFASIANYLVQHGWVSGQPWGVQVSLPNHFDQALIENKLKYSVEEWLSMGVRIQSDYAIDPHWQAKIVHPYGGPDYMVFNNFYVIMKWNRSIYYAGTVGYMADKLCYAR